MVVNPAPPAPAPAENARATRRDAVLFVPGLSRETIDQGVENVAIRLLTAMDRNSKSARTTFRLGAMRDEPYGRSSRARVCTIFRKDDADETPVVDVYGLDYHANFIDRYHNASLFMKVIHVAFAISSMAGRLVRATFSPAQTTQAKVQFWLSILALSTLVLYMGLLLYAVGDIAVDAWAQVTAQAGPTAPAAAAAASPDAPADPAPAAVASVWTVLTTAWSATTGFLDRWAQVIVLTLTAIGVLLPTRLQLRDWIVANATIYTALVMYLGSGERRNVLVGQLSELLDFVQSQQDVEYNQIHLLGYSFGSVVALDALFPPQTRPGARFQQISSIATIGSPYDFVRAFWPRYYDQRHQSEQFKPKWLNVYSPDDVLSSNFRDDGEIGQPTVDVSARAVKEKAAAAGAAISPQNIVFRRRINQEQLSFLDVLFFVGLRSHTMYWEENGDPQINCFDDLVIALYEGQPLLR